MGIIVIWQVKIGKIPGDAFSTTVNIIEPLTTVASNSCSWLRGVEPDAAFCFCSPFTSRFDMLCILKCFSACNDGKEWLCKYPQPSCQLEPLWTFSSDLSHLINNPTVCENLRRLAVSEVHKPSATNKHAMVKVTEIMGTLTVLSWFYALHSCHMTCWLYKIKYAQG